MCVISQTGMKPGQRCCGIHIVWRVVMTRVRSQRINAAVGHLQFDKLTEMTLHAEQQKQHGWYSPYNECILREGWKMSDVSFSRIDENCRVFNSEHTQWQQSAIGRSQHNSIASQYLLSNIFTMADYVHRHNPKRLLTFIFSSFLLKFLCFLLKFLCFHLRKFIK